MVLGAVVACTIPSAVAGAPAAPADTQPAAPQTFAAPTAQASPPPAIPSCRFVGSWVLNEKLSDDPSTAVPSGPSPQNGGERGQGEGGGGSHGGHGGWGGGHGGHGGGGYGGGGGRGGYGSDEQPASGGGHADAGKSTVAAAMSLMREMPATIVVAQHESQFQIVETGGRMTNWQADGKPHLDDRFGTTAQAQIQWDGEKLHSATDLGGGEAFEESYALVSLADGKKLLQVTRTLKVPRGSHTFSIRRVYEPGS